MSAPGKLTLHDTYEAVTSRILELLDKGVVPWQKPWAGGWPQNLFTKRPYGLLNAIMLNGAGCSFPYWATQKQIEGHHGRIREDQVAKHTFIYMRIAPRPYFVNAGEFGRIPRFGPMFRAHPVWNLEQTEGLERYIPKPTQTVPVDEAKRIVEAMPLRPVIDRNLDRAYYSPRKDFISLPPDSQFRSTEEYYSTLFHELIHSTGHHSRLRRKSLDQWTPFGDADYSFEELVAELGAAMLCGLTGLDVVTRNSSAAYIQNWLKVLGDNRDYVLQAAGHAQKACDFIQGKAAKRTLPASASEQPASPVNERSSSLPESRVPIANEDHDLQLIAEVFDAEGDE